MNSHHVRAHFPLQVWQLYLQGAVGVALQRLLAIARKLAVARSDLQKKGKLHETMIPYESLKWSLILQCFGFLELVANGLIQTAVGLHDTKEWRPMTPRGLTKSQLKRLRKGKGWIFIGTIEKLRLAPNLLSTLYSRRAKIDWNELGWQAIRQLRSVRNSLVHVRLADAKRLEPRFKAQRRGGVGFILIDLAQIVAPEMGIPENTVWDALAGLTWYLQMVDRMPGFGENTSWRTNWVFRKNALLKMTQVLDQAWGTPGKAMRSYVCALSDLWSQ